MTAAERHTAALALIEQGRAAEARRHATAGLRTPDPVWAARFRLVLAWIDLDRGASEASLRHLDAAAPLLRGADLARARCLRGLHLCQTADPREAAAALTGAVRDLRRHGEHRWLANALIGRGVARANALLLSAADADFVAAHEVLERIGQHERAVACLHNRGFVATLAGRLPVALDCFERAAAAGLDVTRQPEALLDRAEALLAAGLVGDARRVLDPALGMLGRVGRGSRLPDAVLLAARCAWAADDLPVATRLADRAATLFRAQRRHTWTPVATALGLRARLAAGDRATPAEVRRAVLACVRHGRVLEAAELRVAAGLPGPVVPRRTGGPARLRALDRLAAARTAPDRRSALAACRAGLAVLREHPADPAAAELAGTGLDLALASRRARTVLAWTERRRTVLLARPPLLPPDDPALARALTELRVARARDRPTLRLEERVRRLAVASRAADPQVALDVAALLDALGERALVGFTAHRGGLLATTAVAGRVRTRPLGSVDAVARRVRELRFALSVGRPDPVAAAGLDEALFGGSRAATADRELVVLPDGPLHGLPWSALPSCRGRAVSVAPSAGCWLRAAQSPPSGTGRAWISGPGLVHADRETAALRAAHGGALLTGRAATADAVLTAIDGVAVAHLAVHGAHRDDQPLLSALRVADGPLHGYDLARLRRAPGLVVLSACDSGLAPVLLRAGARTVVASPLPVPDDRAVAVMTALHARLRGGASPAAALAAAQEADDLGFTCHGAG